MRYDPVQLVEYFHLIFLDLLGRKLDKRLFALKGGCNLRFFLGSIRYSQDIDLDVKVIRVATLQKTVDGILESPGLAMMLKTRGIEISQTSLPKQTETTQRWKIQLRGQTGTFYPTKIEFSRRGTGAVVEFDPVDTAVLHLHRLHPIMAPHYGVEVAFEQKIKALALRHETQARDIWDLYHLLTAYGVQGKKMECVDKAYENIVQIGFSEFKDQVIAFLPSELRSQYTRPIWEKIQLKVMEQLEGLL